RWWLWVRLWREQARLYHRLDVRGRSELRLRRGRRGQGGADEAPRPARARAPPGRAPAGPRGGHGRRPSRGPSRRGGSPRPRGGLVRRFRCCLQRLVERLSTIPISTASKDERNDWLLTLLATVREFLVTEGLYDCDLAARLGAVALPSKADEQGVYLQAWSAA